MKRISLFAIVFLSVLLCLQIHDICAAKKVRFGTSPPKKTDGIKFRIGFLQGGDYKDYLPVFTALTKGLAHLGWIEDKNIPQFSLDEGTIKLWEWLSLSKRSKYITFVVDAFYTSEWSEKKRQQTRHRLIERLNTKKDIDLMVAMGTWAGQDLSNNEHTVPTLVFSSSDPLASKIIKSIDDSGYDHLWARIDPTRFERQVSLFHDIIRFTKLGVVYENTKVGRSYASVDQIEKVAREREFEIVPCYAPFSEIETDEATQNVIQCHETLAPKVDAMYITHHRGVVEKKMRSILDPLYKKNIPTFSQAGSSEVRHGVLLSISQANFLYVGRFYAETIAKVLNGAKPRELKQVFESPPKIAINLETAELIGYDPPVDILGAADEIFQKIED